MNKFLISTGIILILLGLLWPWLQKLPIGRLPGDILIHKEHFHFYFPIATSIIISIILSLILWWFRK